ncbi:hypothetical protein Q7P37_009202 [Cladosporium fusiforme]
MFGRKKSDPGSDRTLTENNANADGSHQPSRWQIKRATRPRFIWALIAALLLLISVIFVILVEVGNIGDRAVSRDTYFINLDLSHIVPVNVPNAVLINSIAQTLGLNDFYRVGLWNYCAGNIGVGIMHCSKPKTMWWFNPVEIIQSQLLAGASIALPAEVTQILDIIRLVSHWMFALFLAGACLSTIMIPFVLLTVYTRWATLAITIVTFLAALFTTVATILATAMFIIMQNAITSVEQLNIEGQIGTQMFAFMWIAASCSILAWLITLGQCCCCASRRDVKRGKKRGSKAAWGADGAQAVDFNEKRGTKRGWFGRKRAS